MQQPWLNFNIGIRRLFSHVTQELQPADNNHQYPPNLGGYMVVQLVEALRYKPKGRDFAFQGGGILFGLTLPAAMWPRGRLSLQQI